MSDARSPAATQVPDADRLAERIAAIEADLARITRMLESLTRTRDERLPAGGEAGEGLATLQRDTVRNSRELVAVAEMHARVTGLQVAAAPDDNPPIVMTPLALLSLDSEQLTLVGGIDAAAAGLLNENGIHRFADIAALTCEDVAELGRMLGDARRISKQGWIEQAAVLAAGLETAHAGRIRAGDFAGLVAPPEGATSGAKIIVLSERRARSRGAAQSRRVGLARVAGLAASAAIVAALWLQGAGFAQQLIAGLGIKSSCSTSLSALFSHCVVAVLP